MSSTQKRGFRFRWAAERAQDEGAPEATIDASELGVGGGRDTGGTAGAAAPADSTEDGVTDAASAAGEAGVAAGPGTDPDASADHDPTGVPDTREPTAEAERTEMSNETETHTEADAGAGVAHDQDENRAPDWPSGDRQGASAAGDAATATPRPPVRVEGEPQPRRRENPLVAGLIKAMREAAVASREETTSRVQAEATARTEVIRNEATTEAATLRKRVDDDIAQIREWSKAEAARIRKETEERIEARRAQAIVETKRHAEAVDRRIEHVQATVAAFDEQMSRFFERLLTEDDPARLATLAEQAPEPPDLSAQPWADDAAAPPVLQAEAAAEAEAEASEGLDMADERLPASVLAARLRGLSSVGTGDGDAGRSRLMVSGLASVGAISAFKGAVAQLAGVQTVSVTSGEKGVFIFNVGHDPETDLAAAVANLEGFAVLVGEASDDTVTVTVHEAAA